MKTHPERLQAKERGAAPAAFFASHKMKRNIILSIILILLYISFFSAVQLTPGTTPSDNPLVAGAESSDLLDNPDALAELALLHDVQIEPNTLHIPSQNITAPLVYTGSNSDEAFKIALRDGVVHYPGSAELGMQGNAYFFGHSSDFIWAKGDYKKVLLALPRIENGADIYVSNPYGQTFHYVVRETRVVAADDVSVLEQGDEHLLTLQTSYPIGTAWKRFIAIAELQNPITQPE